MLCMVLFKSPSILHDNFVYIFMPRESSRVRHIAFETLVRQSNIQHNICWYVLHTYIQRHAFGVLSLDEYGTEIGGNYYEGTLVRGTSIIVIRVIHILSLNSRESETGVLSKTTEHASPN